MVVQPRGFFLVAQQVRRLHRRAWPVRPTLLRRNEAHERSRPGEIWQQKGAVFQVFSGKHRETTLDWLHRLSAGKQNPEALPKDLPPVPVIGSRARFPRSVPVISSPGRLRCCREGIARPRWGRPLGPGVQAGGRRTGSGFPGSGFPGLGFPGLGFPGSSFGRDFRNVQRAVRPRGI